MPVSINGNTGVITGLAVGGLPDGIVDADMLAADSVTDGKLNISGEVKAWVHFRGTGTVTILANLMLVQLQIIILAISLSTFLMLYLM